MKPLLIWLRGKKTYILVACGVCVWVAYHAGLLSREAADQVLVLLGFGGVATLRASIAKLVRDVRSQPPPL
jgi:hypothetical protein